MVKRGFLLSKNDKALGFTLKEQSGFRNSADDVEITCTLLSLSNLQLLSEKKKLKNTKPSRDKGAIAARKVKRSIFPKRLYV